VVWCGVVWYDALPTMAVLFVSMYTYRHTHTLVAHCSLLTGLASCFVYYSIDLFDSI
jgi:hypothetical protein